MSKIPVLRVEFKIMQTTCADLGTMQLQLLAVARVNLGQSAERVVEVVMVEVVVTIVVGGVLVKGDPFVLLTAMVVVDFVKSLSVDLFLLYRLSVFLAVSLSGYLSFFPLLCHPRGLSS